MYILDMYFYIRRILKIKNKNFELNLLNLRYFTLKGYIKLFIIFLRRINYRKLDLDNRKVN